MFHLIFYDQLFGVLNGCTPILVNECWIDGQHPGKIAFNRECCTEFVREWKIKRVVKKVEDVVGVSGMVKVFEPADQPILERVKKWAAKNKVELEVLKNPGFMVQKVFFRGRGKWKLWVRFGDFYRMWRNQTGVLMKGGMPLGGKYSFDEMNREKLRGEFRDSVARDKPFHQILPRTRKGAKEWLKKFLTERFKLFGKYQDAILKGNILLYHSGISALLNVGLLRPHEVVRLAEKSNVPLQSKEAFVRQLVWREFMHMVYKNFGKEKLLSMNYFSARKKVPDEWYDGKINSSLSPMHDAIFRAHKHAYLHHIERLMVMGNCMTLFDVHPVAAFDWFIKVVAIDSYEWVMVGNILMCLFNDGGKYVARKPYIATEQYMLRMSNWKMSELDEKWVRKIREGYEKKKKLIKW